MNTRDLIFSENISFGTRKATSLETLFEMSQRGLDSGSYITRSRDFNLLSQTIKGGVFVNVDLLGISVENSLIENAIFSTPYGLPSSFRAGFFKNSILKSSSLSFVDFSDSLFLDCQLINNNFYKSVFTNTRMGSLCRIDKCSFAEADFSDSFFESNIEFVESIFSKSIFSENVDFSEIVFQGSAFLNTVLERANFKYANLKDTIFEKSRASSANFFGSNLSGARFENANLDYSDFSSTDLEDTLFSHCSLKNCNFSNTIISKDQFSNCQLEGAVFS